MVKTAPDYAGIGKRVMRPDLYLEAMKEINVTPKVTELTKVSLFDGSFDATDPEKYARSFPVHNLV
jgi:nitrate/nitrite transport system substrate-binding protein